jgi:hypothetical protein
MVWCGSVVVWSWLGDSPTWLNGGLWSICGAPRWLDGGLRLASSEVVRGSSTIRVAWQWLGGCSLMVRGGSAVV